MGEGTWAVDMGRENEIWGTTWRGIMRKHKGGE